MRVLLNITTTPVSGAPTVLRELSFAGFRTLHHRVIFPKGSAQPVVVAHVETFGDHRLAESHINFLAENLQRDFIAVVQESHIVSLIGPGATPERATAFTPADFFLLDGRTLAQHEAVQP